MSEYGCFLTEDGKCRHGHLIDQRVPPPCEQCKTVIIAERLNELKELITQMSYTPSKEASEEAMDKLVLNKITQQAKWGGFYESIHAGKPVVVAHPKYMADILRAGVSNIVVEPFPKEEGS